ncbi:ABC transporter permease [Clostridium pasteurianum]|uniref:ABC transporter permease n=1 Tax=Clostridium pasteurianum TaxID=1501 RepID=UPI0022609200|nr:ABC transporter permease [Clostridium pasteurianum]UZW14454.1 ABC transporter permease [Clostridium pasteurianum]
MNFSMIRVKALFMKELKDCYRNPLTLISFTMPIIIILLFGIVSNIKPNKSNIFLLSIALNYSTVFIIPSISSLVSEEKEKSTLTVLTLSSITPIEFIISKFLLPFIISLINILITLIIFRININFFPEILIIELAYIISAILIGSIIGILSDTVATATVISIFFLLVLLLIPSISSFNYMANTTANFLVSYHSKLVIDNITKGYSLLYSKYSLFIILMWIVIPLFAFILIYNKKPLA